MKQVLSRVRMFRTTAGLGGALALAVPTIVVGLATPVGAAVPTPAIFSECPVHAFVAAHSPVNACVVGATNEGEFKIGKLYITFHGPGKLQGAFDDNLATPNWADALDGQSFSAPPQLLPEPVLALLGNPSGVTAPSDSEVTAVASQAGPITFSLSADGGLGATLVLPIKFHMENPLLGSRCFIGTDSSPVVLTLTTGTSGTLTGNLGSLSVYDHGNILQTNGSEVVDGQFRVPGASGCGSGDVWDSAIDASSALPSGPGHNAVTLYGGFDLATTKFVAHKSGV